MWWLSRIATAAIPCSGTRSSACSIALTTSQGPGQSSAVPAQGATAVGDDGRIALSGHAAGIERRKIGGGERKAMSGVAEQVALDQDLGDRTCLVWIETGAPKQRRREREQLARPIGRHRVTGAHLAFPSLGNSASDVPRKFAGGQPGNRWARGAAACLRRNVASRRDRRRAGHTPAESGRPRRGRAVTRKGAMLFVITAFDRPGALERRMQVRPAHLEYLKSRAAGIKVGGPLLERRRGADRQSADHRGGRPECGRGFRRRRSVSQARRVRAR